MICTPTRIGAGTLWALFFAAAAYAGGTPALTTQRVASGLARPVFVTHAPNDFDRIFIVEKAGVIKILNLGSGVVSTFMNIDARVGGGTSTNDERGLLGLAFHPNFADNGFFFVNYTNNSDDTRVSRFSISSPNTGDPNSESMLLGIFQPQTNHNGGWIAFGPDGYLYIATGDGGNFCDTGSGHNAATGNAQDLNILLGKMLRIDVDSGVPYGIPPGNPFAGVAGLDEIWAYGLRNPWRDAFDPLTGDLYIADVGQGVWEEVNFQPAASAGGVNYGWRCMEGNHCSSDSGYSTTGCTCFKHITISDHANQEKRKPGEKPPKPKGPITGPGADED